jgi:perosamine synthetase
MDDQPFIPVSQPLLGDNVLPLVRECIETNWISSEGRFIAEFEQQWARYCGALHGVSVSNGTTALQVAMKALKLEPGSEVIIPAYTIICCATAVLEADCVPVLVDADPDTWCMDPEQVDAAVTARTRAIMPVHMFGHPVDMRRIMAIARKHGLSIVEDAAEAHGAEVEGRRVGSFGEMSCFSFYANKIITTGEGGMVLANNDTYADRLRSLRNLGFRPDRRFYHTEIGYNYRLTNMQAAVGVAQIARIDEHIKRKRRMAKAYHERLSDLAQLTLPIERDWAKNVYWMYCVILSDDVDFDAVEFARRLSVRGIDTRPLFLGMHEQPVLRERGLFAGECYPVAERLARRGLYVPSGLTLSEDQIDSVCAAVRAVLT